MTSAKKISIATSAANPYGLISDAETGEIIAGVTEAEISMRAGRAPVATLTVTAIEVTVDAEEVKWVGLERVSIESLVAELRTRRQKTVLAELREAHILPE